MPAVQAKRKKKKEKKAKKQKFSRKDCENEDDISFRIHNLTPEQQKSLLNKQRNKISE